MSGNFRNIKIINIENKNCSEVQERYLVNIFTTAVEKLMPTLARESWFKLVDFKNSDIYAVQNFILLMIRKARSEDNVEWIGIFKGNNKSLKITATIEEESIFN